MRKFLLQRRCRIAVGFFATSAEKAVQELKKKQNVKGMEKKHQDYLSKDFKGAKSQRGNGYIED